MFGSLRKKLEETAAQINPFDGGKTAATVRANRNQTPPAQTIRSQPKQNSLVGKNDNQPGFQITNNSFTRGLSRGFDQVNMFDDGRSWQNRTPTQKMSVGTQVRNVLDTNTEADQLKRQREGQQRVLQNQGNVISNNFGALPRMANTAVNQAREVAETGRGQVAMATNNQDALSASLERQDQLRQNYMKNKGGLFGAGTLYDAEEAKRGDLVTGLKRIGGGTLEGMSDAASFGLTTIGGKQIAKEGFKQALKSQAPNIAKNAVANAVGGGASTFRQDGSMGDIAKSALMSGTIGTVADVGLASAGAVLSKPTTRLVKNTVNAVRNIPNPNITTRLAGASRKIDETLFTPRLNRLDLDTRDALIAYSDRLVGADPNIYGKVESDLISKVRAIGDANGVDLTNGTVVQQLDRIEALLNGYKSTSGSLNSKPIAVDPLESLKQEARKYKSADEFVKANYVAHGTPNKIEGNIRPSSGWYGKATYLTDDITGASGRGGGQNIYFVEKPKGKLLDIKAHGSKDNTSFTPKQYQDAIDNGYDGLRIKHDNGKTWYAMFKEQPAKTKQQLTDLYNQSKPSIKDKVKNSLKKLDSDQGGGYDGGRSATDRATSLKQEAKKIDYEPINKAQDEAKSFMIQMIDKYQPQKQGRSMKITDMMSKSEKAQMNKLNKVADDLYNQALKESQPKAKNTIPLEKGSFTKGEKVGFAGILSPESEARKGTFVRQVDEHLAEINYGDHTELNHVNNLYKLDQDTQPTKGATSRAKNQFETSLEQAGIKPSENLTKKVKTVYDSDKKLRDITTTKKQIVDAQAEEILQGSRGDLLSRVLKEGGISSSAYESLPKGVKRKQGMSADKMAQVLGFDSEDALVKAMQDEAGKPKITKAQARAEAEELLKTGKSAYKDDWKEVIDAETARRNELSQYPVTSKVVEKPSQTMSEAEWDSLAKTPEAQNAKLKTRQSVSNATRDLKEAQKEAVVSGDIKKSQELREKIGEIEKGTKRTPPDLNKRAEEIIPEFEIKDIRGKSNKEVKKAFMERANNYLGSRKAAEFSSIDKARQFNDSIGSLTDKQKIEVIRATDDPTYKSTDKAVQNAVEKLHEQYDEAYKYFTKDKKIDMGYQHSYYPRMYKNPQNGELMSGAEFNLLQRGSARQKGRTADLVAEDFLVTKDPAEALTMYHRTLENAAAGKKFLDDLEQDGFVVKSQEVVRGMRPVIAEGMQTDGMIYYAKPEVAKSLDRLFGTQEASGVFEKLVEKGQGLNSFFQSIVLSGGIPNTPVNAFGFMQVMKSTMAGHPIQAGKAFLKSISRDSTDKFFKQNSDILQLMSKYGLDTRVAYDAKRVSAFKKIGESFKESKAKGLTEAWDQITNDATFQRFMPMLETMHFKNVYNGLSKKMPAEQAAKIAAESTSNFFGKTKIAQQATRSKVASDFAGATLFAPRFRESMINFWVKNAQSLKPGNIGKKEFRDNQKFMVSAALVWGAMESANMALNGNWMHDNPDGKKDKLLIPGVTDDGKTIGIPFLPSIATVPRNLAMGVFNTLSGNFEEAGKNAQSFLSMPLKTATEIGTNENYFGQRIVDEDGTTPDKISQMASHIAKNNMQPWVREGLNIAGQNLPEDLKKTLGIKKKSGFETASNALESPLRFYDPAYFKGGTGKLAAQSKFRGDGTTPITEKTEKNKAGKYTSRDKYDAIIDAYSKQDGEVKTGKYDTKELQKAVKDIEAEIKQEFGRYSGIKDMKFNSNRAIEYAKYKKGLVGKNKIETDKLTKSFVKGLYNSQLKGIEQDIYTLAEDDLKGYYERGEITDQNLSNALAVEKQLFDNGLIDKETLARKLDLNARGYKTAKSGGGGGRRGRSKAGYDYAKALFDANVGSVSMSKDLQSILQKYMKAAPKISKKA